jgi:hypothetical protein
MRSTSKLVGSVVLAVGLLGGLALLMAGCGDVIKVQNNPPSLASIGAKVVTEGETLSFSVSATDAESNPIVFSMIDQPANSQLIDNGDGTGEFTFRPNYSQNGVIHTTFVASDGKTETSETIDITITDQAFTHHGGLITANETWTAANNPHLVSSDIDVAGGAVLTIGNGCQVYFADGKRIRVGYAGPGGLKADGTTFTSVSDTPTRGIWDGLGFAAQTDEASYLDNCTIEYGGGNGFGNIFVTDGAVSITDCTIENSSTDGVYFLGAGHATSFTGNVITDNAGYPVTVPCNYLGGLQGSSLIGNEKDTVIVGGTSVTASASWDTLGVPFLFLQKFTINNGATITLVPGLTLCFNSKAGIIVGAGSAGTLIADGTEKQILFTSTAPSPAAGEWDGLYFDQFAGASCLLANCLIEFAGETQAGAVYVADAAIAMNGCTIRHSGGYGVYLTGDGRFSSFENNTLTANTTLPIRIGGNYAGDLNTNNSYTGNTTDHVEIAADVVDRVTTWPNLGLPYYVSGSVDVENGGVLTIAPDVNAIFATEGGLAVGTNGPGTLIADGSTGQIAMRSTSETTYWRGIRFLANATAQCLVDSCLLDHAGIKQQPPYRGCINLTDCQVSIRYCTLQNGGNRGIAFVGTAYPLSMEGNIITGNADVPVSVDCDYVGYIPSENDFSGNAVDAFLLSGTQITKSTTWENPGIPYIISDTISVKSGVQLTIGPGLELRFQSAKKLAVDQGATLIADGSTAQIKFVIDPASSGNWEGLQFRAGASSASMLKSCLIQDGGNQRDYDASRSRFPGCVYIDDCHICIQDCTISGSKKYGIFFRGNGYADCFTGNVFVDNDGPSIRVEPAGAGKLDAANTFTSNADDMVEIGGDLTNANRLGILSASATWYDLGIPYYVQDSIRVQGTNVVLTIEAGATFRTVRPMNIGVCCGASILCNGTSTNPITFGATTSSSNWGKFHLSGAANDNSVLNYCIFDRAGRDQTCGVEINNCSPAITNCTFSNTYNRVCALCLVGTANPFLDNNTFTNNAGGDQCP